MGRSRWPLVDKDRNPPTVIGDDANTDLFRIIGDVASDLINELGITRGENKIPKKDEYMIGDRSGYQEWVGLPGILEFRLREGPALNAGSFFVSLLQIVNIPELTGVDDDKLANVHDALLDLKIPIPSLRVRLFNVDLKDAFPIHELSRFNAEGKPGSWVRIITYFVVVFLFVVICLLLGYKLGILMLSMIPGVGGLISAQIAAQKLREFRSDVLSDLTSIKAGIAYIISILELSDLASVGTLLKFLRGYLEKMNWI